MKVQIGIDLGTTNTLVYGKIDGKIKPIKIEGEKVFPSVIYVDENENIISGGDAKKLEYLDPQNGIHSSKTSMGTSKVFIVRKDIKDSTGKEKFRFTPTDVAQIILEKVYKTVKKKYKLSDEDTIQAVITVPQYFNANQSDETKKAGENAGFEVLRIITEPVAAAYNIAQEKDGIGCVIDLGGGTFDVSVVDRKDGRYIVLDTDGDHHLGGDDFDNKLASYLIKQISEDLGFDLSSLETSGLGYSEYYFMQSQIRKAATECKEKLTKYEEYNVLINDLFTYDGDKSYHFDFIVKRSRFDKECQELYTRILDKIKDVVENNTKFKKSDIKYLYLVGGSCYIPKVRQDVEDYFGIKAVSDYGLEEQVAQGAAKIADGYNAPGASGEDPFSNIIEDITSHSMGVKIAGGKYDEIYPVGTKYSNKEEGTKCQIYTTSIDNAESVTIEVYEKKNKRVQNIIRGYEENYDLYGSFVLGGIEQAPKGIPQIKVTFMYDLSRTLHVTAEDMKTGAKRTVTLHKGTVENHKDVSPTDFYLAVDVSGSMREHNRIEQAEIACEKLINDTLDLDIHQLGIITFGDKVQVLCGLTHERNELLDAVQRMEVWGGTRMQEAIQLATEKLKDSENAKALILVTDGAPNDAGGTKTAASATKAKEMGISIATIGVQDANKGFLDILASEKDLSFMVHDVEKIADAFGQAVENLLAR